MKRAGALFLVTALFVFPVEARVDRSCAEAGYTVVHINGVMTDQDGADENLEALSKTFSDLTNRNDVNFKVAHNPSHLAGAGDLAQSVTQSLMQPIGVSDRNEILWDIHSQLNTRKVLLVGHSQGTFYTNEVYEYLTANGIPQQAIAVYNVATPAHYVAGHESTEGAYLTSSNDAVINLIRDAVSGPQSFAEATEKTDYSIQGAGLLSSTSIDSNTFHAPLAANIKNALQVSSESDLFGGHSFSDEYLAASPGRIIGEINALLDQLDGYDGLRAEEGCFTPPEATFLHNVENVALTVADVAVEGAKFAWEATASAGRLLARGLQNATSGFAGLFGNGGDSGNQEAALFAIVDPQIITDQEPETAQEQEEGTVLGDDVFVEEIVEIVQEIVENLDGTTPGSENVENTGDSHVDSVDNSGIKANEAKETQENTAEEAEKVNENNGEQEETVENQGQSENGEEAIAPSPWGIKTGGSGRHSVPIPGAEKIFDTTVAAFTAEERIMLEAVISGEQTTLVVWSEVRAGAATFNGNLYDDIRILGRRINADGSWLDIEPLVLSDPPAGNTRFYITGTEHNGEFFVLMNSINVAYANARKFGNPIPENNDGSPVGIKMVRVPAIASADELAEVEIYGAPWNRYYDTMPRLLDMVPHGENILVLFKVYNKLFGGLVDVVGEDLFTWREIMLTGFSPPYLQVQGAEATCLNDYCVIFLSIKRGTQAGLLYAPVDGDIRDWRLRSCHYVCGLSVTTANVRTFNASLPQLVGGIGEDADGFLLFWTQTDGRIQAYFGTGGMLDPLEFPSGTILEEDILEIAHYDAGVYEVAAQKMPETGNIIVVSTEYIADELLVGIIEQEDLGTNVELQVVEGAIVYPYVTVACTNEGCFVGFVGTYQEIEGIHVVPIGDLISS